jgi:hypothetical protein
MSSFEINFYLRGNCGKTDATAQDKDSAHSARSAIARARNPARAARQFVSHEFNRTSEVRFRFDAVWFGHQCALLEKQLQHPRGINPCREWINPSDNRKVKAKSPDAPKGLRAFCLSGKNAASNTKDSRYYMHSVWH